MNTEEKRPMAEEFEGEKLPCDANRPARSVLSGGRLSSGLSGSSSESAVYRHQRPAEGGKPA